MAYEMMGVSCAKEDDDYKKSCASLLSRIGSVGSIRLNRRVEVAQKVVT